MTTIVNLTAVILVLLVIMFIYFGIWFKRMVTSSDDFLLAGRKAPFWLLASAYLGGTVGGASVSGYTGLGLSGGIGQMWSSLFLVGGTTIFVVLFARRLNYFGRKTGAVTICDFACARYGEALRLPIAIVSFLRPGFLTGMQFLAIALALNVVIGISIHIGVIVSAAIILLYMITGGQYSAMVNQLIQGLLQSLGILLFALASFKFLGNPTEVYMTMKETLPASFLSVWEIDFSLFTVWLLTLGVFYLIDPWGYMWAYVGQTPRVSSNAQLAILGGSYYNVLPFLSGMAIAAGGVTGIFILPQGLSSDAFYAWFATNHLPLGIGVLILVGLFMTIISCGSSFAMNGVTIITRDIYQKVINKNATQKQMLIASRLSVVIVVILGIASALWLPILVPLWTLAQALVVSGLLATILCAWFWPRSTKQGAMASTILGGGAALAWAMYAWITQGNPGAIINGLHAVHIGLIISIPAMIIVSLLTKPDYEAAKVTNFKVLGEEMKANNIDPAIKPGFFGWLGAHKTYEKAFWICVFSAFILHYLLAFIFHIEFAGVLMVWISVLAGILMLVLLGVLGFKDIFGLVKSYKESEKLSVYNQE
ncbi:MAG TPA: sodium:solute symporter family protein [Clostridiales bacterium]|nr:sodium:solute symporter family protein [Clostridiales bacterium]